MAEYTRIFTNPYPNGWENLPSTRTPIIAQALQQHTNAIINIENYLSTYEIPTKTSELINDSVPTKLSDLLNDAGYITEAALPTNVSDLNNDAGYITENDIPEDLSEYNNDAGFITNAVNNLLNYYLKSETYSIQEIQQLLANINNWDIRIVNELPTENISETTIYCVRKGSEGIVLASDYDLNLDNDRDSTESIDHIDLGDPVIMAEFVEDPYVGSV